MSGAGKSTALGVLARRGYRVVDTDLDDWTRPDGTWHEPRMTRLLEEPGDVIVAGTVENQGRFAFGHVVLLTAPIEVLLARVATRTTNPYGRSAEQRAEIAGYVATVEPLLRRAATLELDTARMTPEEVADRVAALLGA